MADLEALERELLRTRDRLHRIESTLAGSAMLQKNTAGIIEELQAHVTEMLKRTEAIARADEIAVAVRSRLYSWPLKIIGGLLSLTVAAGAIKGLFA